MTDTLARDEALDSTQSFIVEAPAGSGKTELLAMRAIALLASPEVQHPEEMIALTFTRKACAEMRARIKKILKTPSENIPKERQKLIASVLEKNKKYSWGLLEHSQMLRIETFDGFALSLLKAAPEYALEGYIDRVTSSPKVLYQEACERLLHYATEDQHPWKEALVQVFEHLGFQFSRWMDLGVECLATRDQWLEHLLKFDPHDALKTRLNLEQALARSIDQHLAKISELWNPEEQSILDHLVEHAVYWKQDTLDKNDGLNYWRYATKLLITQEGMLRKTVDKRIGFPAPSPKDAKDVQARLKSMKQKALEFIQSFEGSDPHIDWLRNMQALPDPSYDESSFKVLSALFEVLPLLVAELLHLFEERGCVDFIEVFQRAYRAMAAPHFSEKIFNIQDKIKHVLVDEFQDVSIAQFRFLEVWLKHWEHQPHRTLFCVGDPMQSIYRFRKAEVGLFLKIKEEGIAHLKLKPLRLQSNFRSQEKIVAWMNDYFCNIFPKEDDRIRGKISYREQKPHGPAHTMEAIHYYPEDEHKIVDLVSDLRQRFPEDSIAILVRARSHAQKALEALRSAELPICGQDESWGMLRSDLEMALRFSRNPGDRLAFFSWLRSPYVGLSLEDITYLSESFLYDDALNALKNLSNLPLSEEGKKRLSCWRSWFESLQAIGDTATQQLEKIFLAPILQQKAFSEKNIQNIFDFLCCFNAYLLEHSIYDDRIFSQYLEEQLQASREADSSPKAIHLLTMHGSKGLEFDHIILLGLHRETRTARASILHLREQEHAQGIDLLIAPIDAASDREGQSLISWMMQEELARQKEEERRLLYVAMTRAKKSIHIMAPPEHTSENTGLWSLLSPYREAMLKRSLDELPSKSPSKTLCVEAVFPAPPHPSEAPHAPLLGDWKQALESPQQKMGQLLHELFEMLGCRGDLSLEAHWESIKSSGIVHAWLQEYGWEGDALAQEHRCILTMVEAVLCDPRGHSLLSVHGYREWALSCLDHGGLHHDVIDLCFEDQEGLWVVDYKFSELYGDEGTWLLEQQALHREQLERYGRSVACMYPSKNIFLGLYFPRPRLWHAWPL